ncbi:MAG TPA: glycosyltransferase [bacterium]|nr:glycosyltransferase [bacterium]
MKRVLVVAYYFPPMGMGGVQRALKFARYLPEFGWEPVVLTVRETAYYAHDPTLLDEIPDVRILRTESLDPLRVFRGIRPGRQNVPVLRDRGASRFVRFISSLNEKLIPWLLVPDSKLLWLPFALRAARRLCRTERIDAVFTTSPPHSAHLIGHRLRSRCNIPWIADFRDDWTAESCERLPTPLHRAVDERLARTVLRNADRILAVSPRIARSLSERRGAPGGTVTTLYNGFDANDFATVPDPSRKKFTIAYAGTLNALCDPEPFFAGVRELFDHHPRLRSRIQIRLAGSAYGIDLGSLLGRYGLEETVHETGYVTHRESVRFLMQADLLLLILSPGSGGGMVTGKIFEYLASGKPVLAVVPESEAGRLIRKHRAGRVVHPGDTRGIAEGVLFYYRLWESGRTVPPGIDRSELKSYERREQTRILAGMLDEVSHVGESSNPFRRGNRQPPEGGGVTG